MRILLKVRWLLRMTSVCILFIVAPSSANHLSHSMDYRNNNNFPLNGFDYMAVRGSAAGANYHWNMDDTSAGMFKFNGTVVNWNPVKCFWGMHFLPLDMTSDIVGSPHLKAHRLVNRCDTVD